MSELRAAFKAFGSVYVARIASAGLIFLSTVAVARVLGPASFAAFTTVAAIISVASGLLGPALDTTLVRFAASHKPGEGASSVRVIFSAKLILSALILVAGILFSGLLSRLLLVTEATPEGDTLAMGLAFITAALVTLWATFQAYTQSKQQFSLFAGLEFCAALLRLLMIGGAIFLGFKTVAVMVGCNTIAAFVLVIISLLAARIPKPIASADDIREAAPALLAYAKWVIAASCCTTVFQQLDILYLAYMRFPEETIGHYGAAVRLMLAVEMAILTLFNVLLPKARALKGRVAFLAFMRQFRLMSGSLAIAMIPFVFLSGPASRIIFGPGYEETGTFVVILLSGSIVSLAFAPAGAVIYAMGESHYIAILEASKLLLFAVAGWFAAEAFGAVGVAVAVSGVKAMISVTTYLIARREVGRMPL